MKNLKWIFFVLFIETAFYANGQVFLLSEGGARNVKYNGPLATFQFSCEEPERWRFLRFVEGKRPTDQALQELCVVYHRFFPAEKLADAKGLMSERGDNSYAAITFGKINPDQSVTIYGQLRLTYKGEDAAGYPLIEKIELLPPAKVSGVPGVEELQQLYAETPEMNEQLKNIPPPPPIQN